MHIRLANRRFAPTILACVLTVLGVAVFVRLGMWQLHRGQEKQVLMDRYAEGARTSVELTASNRDSVADYQLVRVQGRYDSAHQILLDNMPSQHGRPGYRVVTPLELEQGGWLLVDRGWLPMGNGRTDLPDVAVAADSRTLTGRLDALPRPGLRLGSEDGAASSVTAWPHVMNFPQHEDLERALDRPLLHGLVLLEADQPDGYEREWHARFRYGPERHVGYAVQWFALALAAVVIFLITSLRRDPAND